MSLSLATAAALSDAEQRHTCAAHLISGPGELQLLCPVTLHVPRNGPGPWALQTWTAQLTLRGPADPALDVTIHPQDLPWALERAAEQGSGTLIPDAQAWAEPLEVHPARPALHPGLAQAAAHLGYAPSRPARALTAPNAAALLRGLGASLHHPGVRDLRGRAFGTSALRPADLRTLLTFMATVQRPA